MEGSSGLCFLLQYKTLNLNLLCDKMQKVGFGGWIGPYLLLFGEFSLFLVSKLHFSLNYSVHNFRKTHSDDVCEPFNFSGTVFYASRASGLTTGISTLINVLFAGLFVTDFLSNFSYIFNKLVILS